MIFYMDNIFESGLWPQPVWTQTWNLSKNLHRLIFRLKILHRQFHLILTVLVRKNKKMSENGEIYTAGKNFTLPPAVTALTHSTSGEDFNTSKLPKQLEYWIEIT